MLRLTKWMMCGFLAACVIVSLSWSSEPVAMRPGVMGLPDYLACLRDRTTLISAHRGGSGPGLPENALETMAETLKAGPMVLEVDVVTSADGVPYLMHDDTLDRTTTGSGKVSEMPWSTVQTLTLKDSEGAVTPFRVPTLREALRWSRDKTILLLDAKRSTRIEDVVRVVAEERAAGRTIVIAGNLQETLKALELNGRLVVSAPVATSQDVTALEEADADLHRIIAWTGTQALAPERMIALRRKGMSVSFGTLWQIDQTIVETGDEGLYGRIAALGVDLLASARPAEAFAAVQPLGRTEAAVQLCNRGGDVQSTVPDADVI